GEGRPPGGIGLPGQDPAHLVQRVLPITVGEGDGGLELAAPGGDLGGPGSEELADQVALQVARSEEHTSELQSRENLVCRLLRASEAPPPVSALVPYAARFRSRRGPTAWRSRAPGPGSCPPRPARAPDHRRRR